MPKMKAAIFVEPGRIVLDDKPIPDVGPLDALMRVTTTTICGTDVHILKGEYPVAQRPDDRPRAGRRDREARLGGARATARASASSPARSRPAATATPACAACDSQDGAGTAHGWKPMGGWRFGNTIDGCQAEYVLVPDAMANLAPVPDGLTDEQVLMCPDIMSTGFSGAESGGIRIGDTVAVFAQGPIGLCATAGAKLMGATTIIGVDRLPERLDDRAAHGRRPRRSTSSKVDPVEEIMRLTDGRGVDVAIEALGTQATFEACLRVLRPGGTLSSLGVYSSDLHDPARRLRGRPRRPQDRHHAVPRRQGAHAPADGGDRVGPRRPRAAGDAPLQARRHRGGLRAVRPPARRRAEGRDHALKTNGAP